MDASPYSEKLTSHWPLRPVSFFLSLFAHAGIVCALAFLPSSTVQTEKRVHATVYKVIQLKKEPIVYWTRVPAALPSISPETPIGDSSSFRGEERSKNENLVIQQPNADPSKQLVWQPEKPARLQTETPLQNMVAVQGKAVPKPFEPPAARTPVPEVPKISAAPELPAAEADLPANVAGLPSLPTAKPKPKTFVPPKEQPKLAMTVGVVTDAPPELAVTAAKVLGSESTVGAAALPRRPAPFVPPPARITGTGWNDGDGKGLVTPPPEISSGGTGSTVTAAVIGLNPAVKMAELPDGSRPAAFSRAAEAGNPSGGASGQGPVLPGVAIAGSRRAAPPLTPLSTPAPPSPPAASFELRVPPTASTMSAPLRPAARTLPRAIEAHFRARIVYVLVIPKPGLPDYIGDWTMWFSERTPDSASAASMRAPLPVRKVLRAEIAAAGVSGLEGWVQVAAVIGKDGKISSVNPMPGRNPVVAAKAAQDLDKWEFRPASRNGEAIEVEVIIEVPFHVR